MVLILAGAILVVILVVILLSRRKQRKGKSTVRSTLSCTGFLAVHMKVESANATEYHVGGYRDPPIGDVKLDYTAEHVHTSEHLPDVGDSREYNTVGNEMEDHSVKDIKHVQSAGYVIADPDGHGGRYDSASP